MILSAATAEVHGSSSHEQLESLSAWAAAPQQGLNKAGTQQENIKKFLNSTLCWYDESCCSAPRAFPGKASFQHAEY